MKNGDKEFFAKNLKIEQKKSRKCMYPDCHNQSINSHVLQKNGILTNLAKNSHLMTLEMPNIWKLDDVSGAINEKLYIKKTGINVAYSFPGFCNDHDTEIFKPIEINIDDLDFSEYKNQLLFAYRGLCNELHRKVVATAFMEKMLENLLDQGNYIGADRIGFSLAGFREGVKNLKKFKTTIEEDLFGGANDPHFSFRVFEFPKFEVALSVVLNVQAPHYSMEDMGRDALAGKQIPMQFLNIFPTSNKSIVIIGEQIQFSSDFFSSLESMFHRANSIEEYTAVLSDLITARLEFWCMNPELYATLDKIKIRKYLEFFNKNVNNHEFSLHSGINIFS